MFDLADLPRPIIRYAVGVWRRRWIVMIGAWACALAGWFGVWLLPDKFESRAQVFVQTESILEPVMNGVTARPNYEARVDVMRQQLLSRPNVEAVIYRAGLDGVIEASGELDRRVKMERLIDWVASSIKIESPQDRYFVITYRFGDAAMARDVVDAVLNLLIEQDLGASLEEKEEARRLLNAEIARFESQLKERQNVVAEFRRLHAEELSAVEGDARRRDQVATDLQRIGDQLASEQQRVATLRTLLSQTSRTSTGDELDRLKVQLAQLRSQYEEGYPDIQNVKARISELESASTALPSNPEHRRLTVELATSEGQVEALKQREATLRADQQTLAVALGQAPNVQVELQRLMHAMEQTQKGYNELLDRRTRLSLTTSLGAGGQGVEYKVFERPTIALRPAAPPRLILILGVLVLAIAAGVGLALALTMFDRTFTQPDDLKDRFGLPVLGSFSVVSSAYTRALVRRDRMRLAGAAFGLLVITCFYAYWAVLRLPASTDANGAQTASTSSDGEIR